jgi:hypothetical protein
MRQWLAFAGPKADHEYIVTVTGHYLIVHGDRYFDNGCHLGKPVERCPYLNKTVKRAWRVTGKALVLAPKPKFSLAALRRGILSDGSACASWLTRTNAKSSLPKTTTTSRGRTHWCVPT